MLETQHTCTKHLHWVAYKENDNTSSTIIWSLYQEDFTNESREPLYNGYVGQLSFKEADIVRLTQIAAPWSSWISPDNFRLGCLQSPNSRRTSNLDVSPRCRRQVVITFMIDLQEGND